jgi:ABC-type bacteriocin/lantibiotic exporter with double-glycine peptidase domain
MASLCQQGVGNMKRAVLYVLRLLGYAFRVNPTLYAALAVSLLSVAVELAAVSSLIPLSTLALGQKLAADSVFVTLPAGVGLPPSFQTYVFLFVTFFVIRLLMQLASQGMAAYFGRKLLAQLASRAFENIVAGLSLREIEKNSIGYFISLAGDESFRASTIVISITQLFATSALALLYFAAIAFYSIDVALGVALFLLLSGTILLGALRRSQFLGERQIEQSRAAGSLFLDALNGLRVVRSFSAESYVTTSYADGMFAYVKTLFRIDFINLVSKLAPALLLLVGLLVLVILFPPSTEGGIAPAVLVTVLVLLLRFFPVTGQALSIFMRVIADTKAARDVLAIAQAPETSGPPLAERAVAEQPGKIGVIEFRGLGFSHNADKPVLAGFSAVLRRGESYALIGPSGSGKSTLFDLLLGFYDLAEGQILIDGVPIKGLGAAELRRRILLVSQQTVIFNDSVDSNVRFGWPATREVIEHACRLARVDDVIRGLPRGYDTILSYQGMNLSGGQRQRIGVARALLRQPEVLLLDEVTAGLDHQVRDELVSNVLAEYKSKIVVFATHDRELASMVDHVISIYPFSQATHSMVASSNG